LLFAELLQAHRKRPKTSGEKVVDPIFRPFFVGLRRFLRALAKTRQTAQICLDSKIWTRKQLVDGVRQPDRDFGWCAAAEARPRYAATRPLDRAIDLRSPNRELQS
jgi:hypothetical protein